MSKNIFEELQTKTARINSEEIYANICNNIKKYRLEKYKEFKATNTDSTINPYSTENIAALLDYNHNHYKRFESANDSTKRIPLDKLGKLSIILDRTIDQLMELNRYNKKG